MSRIDDSILMAYVDGELDAEEARIIEARADEPEVARRIRQFRELDALLNAAYADKVGEDLPPRLVDTITTFRPKLSSRRPWRVSLLLGIAASLAAFILGTVTGKRLDALKPDAGQADLASVAELILPDIRQEALETLPSGTAAIRDTAAGTLVTVTPIRTYRAKDGGYCRHFQEFVSHAGMEHTSHGLACRLPDGQWRLKYRVIAHEEADSV